jgi:hypothetical protein
MKGVYKDKDDMYQKNSKVIAKVTDMQTNAYTSLYLLIWDSLTIGDI